MPGNSWALLRSFLFWRDRHFLETSYEEEASHLTRRFPWLLLRWAPPWLHALLSRNFPWGELKVPPPPVKVLVTQSCLPLCDPMDYSLPSSSVHGILQARILEWVAIPFFRGSSWPRDRTQVSCIAGWFFTIWATREAHILLCSNVSHCYNWTFHYLHCKRVCYPSHQSNRHRHCCIVTSQS